MTKNKHCNFDLGDIVNKPGTGLQVNMQASTSGNTRLIPANSKGDYNNDGIDDVIFAGNFNIDNAYLVTYVIYGSSKFNESVIDLSNLTPGIGFGIVFDVLSNPQCKYPIIVTIDSGFDINHDGIDDMYVSLLCNSVGYGYVIYGRTEQFPVSYVYLSDLPQSYYDIISYGAIPVGDVNGDGYKDLLVSGSASNGEFITGSECQTKVTYILGQNNSVSLDFKTTYCGTGFLSGMTTSLGDINGDELADFAISDLYKTNDLIHQSGTTYVVYGTKNPESFSINNLTQDQGYTINGYEINQMCGRTLNYIGSINGDNINDISISCNNKDMFVVYGQEGHSIDSINLNTISPETGLYANASNFGGTGNANIFVFAGLDSFTGQNISSFMYFLGGGGNNYPIVFEGQIQYPFPFDLNSGNYVQIVDTINAYSSGSANRDIGDINGDNLTDVSIVGAFHAGGNDDFPGTISLYVLFGSESFFDCWFRKCESVARISWSEFYERKDLLADSVAAFRYELKNTVLKYNSYRPHFNLNGLTLYEYCNNTQCVP